MAEIKQVAVAEFKRNFHQYAADVLRGARIRVVRHGRPIGDFVPAGSSVSSLPVAERPGGLLALAGLFSDWDEMDEDMRGVVASRSRAGRRPPPDLG